MQTNLFLISLLFCSLTLSLGVEVKRKFKQTNLTESQIIKYDLTKIQDCNSFAIFKQQLDAALDANNNTQTILSNANETIFEALDLMAVIISYENSKTASFLLRSARIKRISKRKAETEKNQLRIAEAKNELQIINDSFEFLSDEGKKNIQKLNKLYISLSSSKTNETPLDLANQIIDLLEKIDEDIVDALNNAEDVGQKLENKNDDILDLAANLNC